MASKRGIEAGRAYVRASLDDSLFHKGLRGMRNGVMAFGRALPSIASAVYLFQKLGTVVSRVGNRITEALGDIHQMDKTAKAFGVTSEQASRLFGVFRASGATNARENIESMVTMAAKINDAMTGKGEEAQKLFKGLSVSAKELSKLPIDEQFFRLHEALRALPNPMDRVNRLMIAFGEDGGKWLLGTLAKSTPELRALAGAYQMTAEETEAATKAQESIILASAAIQRVWNRIAVELAPLIVSAIDGFSRLAHWVNEWAKQNVALQSTLTVLKTIMEAMQVRQWGAAWNVAWTVIRGTFATGLAEIQSLWLDATTGLAMVFIDLSASVQSIWNTLTTFLVSSFSSALSKMLSAASSLASQLGLSKDAMTLGMLSTMVGGAGAGLTGNAEAAEIEKRRQQTQATLTDDAMRRRAALDAASKRAQEDLVNALADAKDATEAAKEGGPAAPEAPRGPGINLPTKVSDELNTAAIVGKSSGAEAVLRATQGRGADDLPALQKEANKIAKDIEKNTRRGTIVLAPGTSR